MIELYKIFFLDSNILNGFVKSDSDAAEIMRLIEEYDLFHCFLVPHSVVVEVESESTPSSVKNKLDSFLRTVSVGLNNEEIDRLCRLFQNAKGNSEEKNIYSDLQHIAEAAKYGAHYFITSDKRLLKRKDKIKEIYPNLSVIEVSAAVKIIHELCRFAKELN